MLPRYRRHHDHPHNGHDHHHDHAHRHEHAHAHGGAGHNHPVAHELHSHRHGEGVREDLQALAEAFIDGFRQAEDKTSYLRLAGVPDSMSGPDGLNRRLVDVSINDGFQVATASPAFGTRDLVYLPYPGGMVRQRTKLVLTYVSLTGRSDIDLIDFLAGRFAHNVG